MFSSLIAQLVERHFYGMFSSAEILFHHIGLLKKNNTSLCITPEHFNTDDLLHVVFKTEMLFLLPIRRIHIVTALPN